MRRSVIRLLPLGLVAVAASQAAQDPPPIEAALTATELKFAKSASGLSYTVDFEHTGKPTRRIYVTVAPSTMLSLKMHTIYTTVWVGKAGAPPPMEILEQVMSSSKKLGTFYVFKDTSGTYAVRFGANFNTARLTSAPAIGETGVTTLKDTIFFVNNVGQEMSDKLAESKP